MRHLTRSAALAALVFTLLLGLSPSEAWSQTTAGGGPTTGPSQPTGDPPTNKEPPHPCKDPKPDPVPVNVPDDTTTSTPDTTTSTPDRTTTGTTTTTTTSVDVYRGTYVARAVDLVSPSRDVTFTHGRTYDSLRVVEGETVVQGQRWLGDYSEAHLLEVEIVEPEPTQQTEEDPTGGEEGTEDGAAAASATSNQGLALVFDASTQEQFANVGGQYQSTRGTRRIVPEGAGAASRLRYITGDEVLVFYGFDPSIPAHLRGRIETQTNRYDQEQNGFQYNSLGQLELVTLADGGSVYYIYDPTTALRRYILLFDAAGAVFQVVDYMYYEDVQPENFDLGSTGDLIQVRVQTRGTGANDWRVKVYQYRYYRGGDEDGFDHQLKAVFEPAAVERVLNVGGGDITSVEQILTLSDDADVNGGGALRKFSSRQIGYYTADLDTDDFLKTSFQDAEALFRYGGSNVDEVGRVKFVTQYGDCISCGSTPSGGATTRFFYTELTGQSLSLAEVVGLVIVDEEGELGTGIRRTVIGTNRSGALLRRAIIADPSASELTHWSESFLVDSKNRVVEARSSEAHQVIQDDGGLSKFLDPGAPGNDASTVSSTEGKVHIYERNPAFSVEGRVTGVRLKQGVAGVPYYRSATTYGSGAPNQPNDLPVAIIGYPNPTTQRSAGTTSTFSYVFSDPENLRLQERTVTAAAVPVGENGSGVASSVKEYFDDRGNLRWAKDAEGVVSYYSPHPTIGANAIEVEDVDTNSLSALITGNGGGQWTAWTGGVPAGFQRDSSLPAALQAATTVEFDGLGRPSRRVQPGGVVELIVRSGAMILEVFGWEDDSQSTVAPVQVQHMDGNDRTVETFAVPSDQLVLENGLPVGLADSLTSGDYLRWTRITDDPGRMVVVDSYHSTPASGVGALGTHFHRYVEFLDDLGRVELRVWEVDESGNVEQFERLTYDALDRVVKVETGVSGPSHDPGPSYANLPPMAVREVQIYQPGTMSSQTIARRLVYHGLGSHDYYGTDFTYDYRGNLRMLRAFTSDGSSETTQLPVKVYDYTWSDRLAAEGVFGVVPTAASVLSDAGYAASVESGRLQLNTNEYDRMGRLIREIAVLIDQSTGSKVGTRTNSSFYDRNSRRVAAQVDDGSAVEIAYDALGRMYETRHVSTLELSRYSPSGAFSYRAPAPHPNLASMSGGNDGVLEISHLDYSLLGVTGRHVFEVAHSDTNGLDLSGTDHVRRTVYDWVNELGRTVARADYGSGDTSAGAGEWKHSAIPARPATPPSQSSESVRVVSFTYGAGGGLRTVRQSNGNVDLLGHDKLGRRIFLAENFVDFDPATLVGAGGGALNDEDRVTVFRHNGLNRMVEFTALGLDSNGNSMVQTTEYLYEDPYSAQLRTGIVYPDEIGDGTGIETVEYRLDGSRRATVDQNGTRHEFEYDGRGRQDLDRVATLAPNLDGTVRSIRRVYDAFGRTERVQSFASVTGTGTPLNEVVFDLDVYGNTLGTRQEHNGAATASSPTVLHKIDYTIQNGRLVHRMRLDEMVYPNGRTVEFDYGATGGFDDRLSRVAGLDESGQSLVEYAHNGRRRLVEVDLTRSSVSLSDHQGDGDSAYEGLDRFARRVDHYWAGYGSGNDVDRFRYTYDVSGSRTSRDIDSALYSDDDRDQAYQYDALRRLTDFRRGKLVGGQIADVDSERDEQWILSTLGNWDQYRWDPNGGTGNWVTQTRAFNAVNEVDVDDDHANVPGNSISGANGADWVDPTFDANGNMTSGPAGFAGFEAVGAQFTYDAWNRVVVVSDGSGNWVRRYEYDGLGHRIVKQTFAGGTLMDTFDLYQNYFGQTVEIRKNGAADPYKQYVWHPHNLTGIAACFFDPDTDGQSIAELNFTDDANGNVTGILWVVGGAGIPVERVDYDAYGSPQFLDANFNVSSSPFISAVDHNILYGGYEFDEGVGIYNLHFRSYHPRLGRWLQRDPVNYADGQNLYEYTQGAPLDYVDHLGLSKCKKKVLKTESVGYSKSWPFPPVRVRGGPYAKIETGGGITQSVSGSRKQKCCPDCRIVWDEEISHSVTVSIWIRGTAGIDEKIGNVSVFGGIQLELSGSGTGSKKISTDGCKGGPAKAEICIEADVTGTARGGIDIEIDVFWWYTARIAAVIEASVNVDSLGFCCDCPAMTNCKVTQDPGITVSWKFTFCIFGLCFSVGGEKKF